MTNFVWIEAGDREIKLKNLNFVWVFIWFVWMVFHFTIVFFFWMVLDSMILVWIFLWIWNLLAMLIDIPVWVLQKYIKSKTFLLIASSMMFIVSLIFLKFIYFKWIAGFFLPQEAWVVIEYSSLFLDSSINIILLLIAACFYWLIKESFDVTTLSYILNIWTPSEYASLISKYNIHNWIGSLLWLIFSWILLALDIRLAIIIFAVLISIFILFIKKYFDNHKETIEFWKVKNLKLDVLKEDLLKKKQELISKVNPETVVNLSREAKVILLKPVEIKKSINFKEVYDISIEWFKIFFNIVFKIPRNLLVLWFMVIILQYWFWDTFVSTFQVEFLEKIISQNWDTVLVKNTKWILTWYVLLWLMVIPAFVLQDFFINLSKKLGVFKVIMFWNFISAISLFSFWVFNNIYVAIVCWIINSVWYAATMPLAQSVFWGLYNSDYAKKFNLTQIDSTSSAAPLKIILNFANVVWLVLWWFMVWLFGFNWFFIFFSIMLLIFFCYSMINMEKFSTKEDIAISQEINNENKNIDPDFV